MKKLFTLFLLALLPLVACAQAQRTIHVETAGTLSDYISDDEKYTIKELTLTGEINGDDFRLLRDMAGKAYRSVSRNPPISFRDTNGKLSILDLSGVKIVAGGNYADWDDGDIYGPSYDLDNDNEIPPYVFLGCKNLISIKIPESIITIGTEAFAGTAWYDSQPDGMVYIGKVAYAYKGEMPEQTKLTIKDGTLGIACSAFQNQKNLTSITIPNSVIAIGGIGPDKDIYIGETSSLRGHLGVFEGCTGLTTIELPNSIKYLGQHTFLNCSGLTSISLPNSVEYLGLGAFSCCSGLTSVELSNSLNSIDSYVFYGCISLTSVTIPESVTSIGKGAFCACGNLTSVMIPQIATSIGDGAFQGCSGLTSLSIPSSVTTIGRDAFWSCKGLNSISVGSGVTSIGSGAFAGCNNVTTIVVDDGNMAYDSRNNCNAIIEKATNSLIAGCNNSTIPDGVTVIDTHAFLECSGLTSVTIPNSVTTINYYAFYGCSGLTCVTIPSSVTSINAYAFSNCSGLTEMIVDESNTVYDSRDNCNAIIETQSNTLIIGCMKTIIPNSVTSIGNYAFQGCSGLTSVTIPNSVTSMDNYAFQDCSSLTSVIIPNRVTSVGYSVFFGCSSLTNVYCYAENLPETSYGAFYNSNIANATLHVPAGSVDAYKATEPWGGFKEIVGVPQHSLVYIVDGEVYKSYQICEGASITPETAPTKDGYVFSGWITIPATMPAEDLTITGTFWLATDVDEIVIKDIGKTTWCSEYDLDFTDVAGIKAYTATGYDDIDKTIWLTRVMKVPAGTGLMVKGDAGTYKIPHSTVRAVYANFFKGNLGETIKIEETDGDKTNYYLSGKDGSFVSVSGNANIGKNKAYLQLPTSIFAGTRTIGVSFDDEDGTTAIRETKQLKEDGAYYTLQGQRVQNPGKGLYIKDGKVVVIK